MDIEWTLCTLSKRWPRGRPRDEEFAGSIVLYYPRVMNRGPSALSADHGARSADFVAEEVGHVKKGTL
jgi:hypothetical protein